MIKIVKDYNDIPLSLLSSSVQDELEKIINNKKINSSKSKFYPAENVKQKLIEIYHNKCAYCEVKTDSKELDIEHYRPKSVYYWTSFEWSNLLPACFSCNSYKANYFPIQNENHRITKPQLNRKEWLANSTTFLSEKPLLLNPEIDIPQEHLRFLADGRVIGLTKKGKHTIEIVELNRNKLLTERNYLIQYFQDKLNHQLSNLIKSLEEYYKASNRKGQNIFLELAFNSIFLELLDRTRATNSFTALGRAMVDNFEAFFTKDLEKETKEILLLAFKLFKENTNLEKFTDYKITSKQSIVITPIPVTLNNLKIQNIKCFENVNIDFQKKNTIILGINGRGKTTILQLIALGLTRTQRPPFENEWIHVIRNKEEDAFFEMEISIRNKKHQLKFTINDADEVTMKSKNLKELDNIIFLAYGTGRNSLSQSSELRLNENFKNVATLFSINSLVKNGEIENYLKTGNGFSQIKRIITQIFNSAEALENRVVLSEFDEGEKTFLFTTPMSNNKIPLNAMSSGFRISFQWILDMVIRMWEKGFDLEEPKNISGIVLIDEIDTHLHLKWQRTILNSLNTIFENIQFIVTTHSPFIVQSISDKSIIALHLSDTENKNVLVERIEMDNGSSYKSIINKIFDTQDIFNVEIEDKFKQFYQRRDEILKGEANIEDKQFNEIIAYLSNQGEEVNNIIRREQRQLEYLLEQH